jgi:hypothetical protein
MSVVYKAPLAAVQGEGVQYRFGDLRALEPWVCVSPIGSTMYCLISRLSGAPATLGRTVLAAAQH